MSEPELFSSNEQLFTSLKIPYSVERYNLVCVCPICAGRLVIEKHNPWSFCLTLRCEARDWSWERTLAELGGLSR